jgi:cystathionine beta-lyase/cystathionine gamma-synthase
MCSRSGTLTSRNFENMAPGIKEEFASILYSSGLNAPTTCLRVFHQSDDSLFMVDSLYLPTRQFCKDFPSGLEYSEHYSKFNSPLDVLNSCGG